jgi:hypothetical protein
VEFLRSVSFILFSCTVFTGDPYLHGSTLAEKKGSTTLGSRINTEKREKQYQPADVK